MEETFSITLKNDYAFKRLLGSEENTALLQDFLECVLDIPTDEIAGLELLDKELTKESLNDKTGILDVKLKLKSNTVIDIEIQNSWNAEFVPRILFYWSKMYIENFKEGQPYTTLHKCVTINIIAQGFPLNKEVHSIYTLLEQKAHERLTDLLEIHFLDLSAAKGIEIYRESADKQHKLINWLKFIETTSKEERAMLATTSPVLQLLNEKVNVLTLTPTERKLYESRMKLKSDIATISEVQYKAGMQHGKSLGLAEGSRQKAIETGKMMYAMNYPIEDICKISGLSAEEVEKL